MLRCLRRCHRRVGGSPDRAHTCVIPDGSAVKNALAQLVDGPVAPREVAGGFAFTECPAADAAGGIWFTDPAYGREPAELEIGEEAVYWISPDRKTLFITARDKVYTLPINVAGGG
ncbi:MAG: hypothetical protein ACK54F_10015 [Planctomycetia bacterium]|jgi:hypothetical protein